MKNLIAIMLLSTIISFTGLAQIKYQLNKVKETNTQSYPIDGTPLLRQQDLKVAQYLKAHPEELAKMKLRKTASWGFTVGSKHSWYAYNFVKQSSYSVSSTCRSVGTHCYIFVEDSLWGNRVNQAAVDSVQMAFDNRTPANPNKGIYQTDVDAFGNPPDVDGDPRIIILILNIQDGYNGHGGYTAGYFSSSNELNKQKYFQSNVAEIYYLDADPVDLNTARGIESAMSTTAHEFQHMIHWNYHQTNPQMTFINEGCSVLAEVNCGYPIFPQSFYMNETNHYLFDWRTNDNTKVLNDYSRAARFFVYLDNQFGIGLFKDIVNTQYYGVTGLNDALARYGASLRFHDIFVNWLIANELDDTSVNPAYGYKYPNLMKPTGQTFYNPNNSSSDNVANLGADYLNFKEGSDLKINFSSTGSNVIVKAIEIGDNNKKVVDVPLNSQFAVPGYGTTYNKISFVVMDTSQSTTQNYSFTSSGTASTKVTELKWDESEPTGYFNLTSSDTVCVTFDPYPGGKLDSISVALRQAGSIDGSVWEFTGTLRPTPLGKKLTDITASTTNTPPNPYPVPYNNWSTIDLTSKGISTNNAFAVGFVIGSNPAVPGVMVTDYKSTSPYHSFTYLHKPSSGSADWYYLTTSDTTIALYLIRAYVTIIVSGVEKHIVLSPSKFSLSQNYPNPFNPSTTINFSLAKSENVRIIIYNQLGQMVKELVNKNYSAGNHQVHFDGASLSSGIYFYKIISGNFSQTKKMILLK